MSTTAATDQLDTADLPRRLRSAMLAVAQVYSRRLGETDLASDDVFLLGQVLSVRPRRDHLLCTLSMVTVDPEATLARAVRAGLVQLDDAGRVVPTEAAEPLYARLSPKIDARNVAWRRQLAETYSPDKLDLFLAMLQRDQG